MGNINIDNYIEDLFNLVEESYYNNEIPVGSIVLLDGKIIGKGCNTRQKSHNVLGHAEINAILEAESYLNDWRLDNCILISTLKPCNMCLSVIKEARISRVLYLFDQDTSVDCSICSQIKSESPYYSKINILFNNFFINLRK